MVCEKVVDWLKGVVGITYCTLFFFMGVQTAVFLTVYFLCFPKNWPLMALYIIWIYLDSDTSEKGGRKIEFLRRYSPFNYIGLYFPIKARKIEEYLLDKKKNYLFVVVPHGWLCFGFYYMCTTRFDGIFPGFEFYATPLRIVYKIPFLRETILASGHISSSARAISHVLSRPGGGNVVGLVPGGAEEAFYTDPGVYKTILKKRKGFVKLALKNGSPLVPVINFGDVDTMKQYRSETLLSIQKWVKKNMGFVPLIPKGRCFPLSFIPFRKPINIVVGKPIEVEKVESPTLAQIDKLHSTFVEEIEKLFEEQKWNYIDNPKETKLEFV